MGKRSDSRELGSLLRHKLTILYRSSDTFSWPRKSWSETFARLVLELQLGEERTSRQQDEQHRRERPYADLLGVVLFVPTISVKGSPSLRTAANPKSHRKALPSLSSRMFSNLTSRWQIPRQCRSSSAHDLDGVERAPPHQVPLGLAHEIASRVIAKPTTTCGQPAIRRFMSTSPSIR
jgi:hypothetical protein